MQGRIVIPLHNEQGELVGYAGRWPGEPPEGEPRSAIKPVANLSLWPSCFHHSQ